MSSLRLRVAVDRLLRSSAAARRVADNAAGIREVLGARDRKTWPVATVAGIFGVSVRLLWQWIDAEVMRKAGPPGKWIRSAEGKPLQGMRSGISTTSLFEFLKAMERCHSIALYHPMPRKKPASTRCREAASNLPAGDNPTTPEFAARMGVSQVTVRRLMWKRMIPFYRTSPGRFRIGKKPRVCAKTN